MNNEADAIIECPKCQAKLTVRSGSAPKKVRCPKCAKIFHIAGGLPIGPPRSESEAPVAGPPRIPSMTSSAGQWQLRRGDGTIFGPFTLNDLQNFASQGKLAMDTCVHCPDRFGDDWVAVGRIPELVSLIRQAADIAHLSGNHQPTTSKKDDAFSASQIATFISGGSYVLAAGIWLMTIIGLPLAIIAAFMAGFDIVSAATVSKRDFHANRARFKLVGILDIVCGFITLGNLIAIICGIVNLASLPADR